MNKPTVLIILDGFGHAEASSGNAVALANMPFWRQLCTQYPTALLNASGDAVGLLPGSVGNSEAGHMTLGAGRVVPSALLHFDQLLEQGLIATSPVLHDCLAKLKPGTRIHLLGLVSNGGVHSDERHLHALLKIIIAYTTADIFIHPILDGRDVLPSSAEEYLVRLELVCKTLGRGSIASIQGRFYGMDRDHNEERTSVAVRMLLGQVPVIASTWRDVLEKSYKHEVTDEFIVPMLFSQEASMKAGDGVIFFNTRPDRARQITDALLSVEKTGVPLAFFLTPVYYDPAFAHRNNQALFEQPVLNDTLLHVLAQQKKKVFVIAETEKYAHVTYFFQGLHEEALSGQERVLIPSLKLKNYVAHPEMAAHQITSTLIKSLRSHPAFFYVVNFANADMVGHSGNVQATSKACEIIDQQLALLYHEVVVLAGGVLCVTADHGNAECKKNSEGHMITAHTKNPVPFVLAGKHFKLKHMQSAPFGKLSEWGLASVAPTLLWAMRQEIPEGMGEKIKL